MDNPLTSILRPGPAAPASDQTRREPPVDGGDAAARRAVEQTSSYPPPRQTDWSMPQASQQAAAAQRVVQDTPVTVREPQGMQPQAHRQEQNPVPDNRATVQPAAAEDYLAGLEQAAMRDIGNDIGQKDDTDGETQEERRKRRKAARAEKTDADEDTTETGRKRGDRAGQKLRRQENRAKTGGASLPATTTGASIEAKVDKAPRKKAKGGSRHETHAPRERGIPWTALSFTAMVLVPAAIAVFYYFFLASPQYRVETQFAVRGSSQSSISTMGLPSILGGTSSQTGDSYIVTSYVESLQLIRDVQQELGIDLRQYFARDNIDWMYRIDPDMPLEKFTEYWRDMTDVSFNSTTGNTTLYIYAFSAEDSKAIADAVLKVSEKLVNELSESNRQQVMQVASKQVDRAEERLRKVQGEIRKLRQTEQTTDPAALIGAQNELTRQLQGQLTTLKTRLGALLKSVNSDAPQAKALQKQIDAVEAQLKAQESQLGTDNAKATKNMSPEEKANLADVLNKFEELTIEQGFATQAYTTALAAFETAIVEAQRQERYFATFVAPTRPEIALYPMRYLDSFIAFLVLLAGWMATQFLYRSFRDHAI